MTEEDFIALVKRAEQEVENNPKNYKIKLFLFAILGYVVIFSLLFALLFLISGSVAAAFYSSAFFILLLKKKLIILLVVMAWVLLKSLWVRFDKPKGFALKRSDFPQLYTEIDNLRDKLDALPIHEVILTPEFNAAVVQTPRLGILGWQHNTLFIGLELLMVLSVEEARAVLAHELGHLSHNHSRFAGWIYRVRISWDNIMHAFDDKSGIGVTLIKKFFYWYAPHFAAYSFALARSNEYEADAMSAQLTSPEDAARALINTHITAPYVNDNYWEWFFKKADATPKPEQLPWVGLTRFLSDSPQTRNDIIERFKVQMKEQSVYYNTHPSLKDRLEALNSKPVLPQPVQKSAAHFWLGNGFDEVVRDFDRKWWNVFASRWQERFEYASEAKQKLVKYRNSALQLSDEELWEYANLTYEFDSDDKALPVYQEFQTRHPDSSKAAYAIGVILFDKNDRGCLQQFNKAFSDPKYTVKACRFAYDFLTKLGEEAEADIWERRALVQIEKDDKAEAERSQVTETDTLIKPDINQRHLNLLVEQLKTNTFVRAAWLAQKVVKYYPQEPVYIVTFKSSFTKLSFSWDAEIKSIMQSLDMPFDIFVVAHGGDYKTLSNKVIKAGRKIIGCRCSKIAVPIE